MSNQNDQQPEGTERSHVGVGVAIGIAIGVSLGVAMDQQRKGKGE